jgi:hypothetical protein
MNPQFHFHTYRELESWALMFSLTTRNLSIQIGPFIAQLFWRTF